MANRFGVQGNAIVIQPFLQLRVAERAAVVVVHDAEEAAQPQDPGGPAGKQLVAQALDGVLGRISTGGLWDCAYGRACEGGVGLALQCGLASGGGSHRIELTMLTEFEFLLDNHLGPTTVSSRG